MFYPVFQLFPGKQSVKKLCPSTTPTATYGIPSQNCAKKEKYCEISVDRDKKYRL